MSDNELTSAEVISILTKGYIDELKPRPWYNRIIPISRPCYDKIRRCPGWAGGGYRYPKRMTCAGGYLSIDYTAKLWRWKMHKHTACGVWVLPSVIRWIDWRWLRWEILEIPQNIRDWYELRQYRKNR